MRGYSGSAVAALRLTDYLGMLICLRVLGEIGCGYGFKSGGLMSRKSSLRKGWRIVELSKRFL